MARPESLGIENDQDDVDRRFLSGDFGRLDRDQDCFAAGFRVCRNRATSKYNRGGTWPERGGEVRPVGVAEHPRRDRRDRDDAGCPAAAGGNSGAQARDNQDAQPALARCQRQDRTARAAASSTSHSQRAKKEHGQQPPGAKSRSLALPAGCHGQPFEVTGPFAKMQSMNRAEPPAIRAYWKFTSKNSAERGRNPVRGSSGKTQAVPS
jgi:hypothetical protein